MEKHNLKKKKATRKELEKLREMVIEVQRDPVAMMQIRKLIAKST